MDKLGVRIEVDYNHKSAKDNLDVLLKKLQSQSNININIDQKSFNNLESQFNKIKKQFENGIKTKTNTTELSKTTMMYTQMFDKIRIQNEKKSQQELKNANNYEKFWIKALKNREIAEINTNNKIQGVISKTMAKRLQESLKLEESQSKAINKNMDKYYLNQQSSVYNQIKNVLNSIYSIKTKLLKSDTLATNELNKQLKQNYERLKVLNQQKNSGNLTSQDKQNALLQQGIKLRDKYNQSIAQSGDIAQKSSNKIVNANSGIIGSIESITKKATQWAIAMAGVYGGVNQIRDSIKYINTLDKSLTEISIVTGKSRQEMRGYSQEVSRLAKQYSQSQEDIASASVTYFRQGKTQAEVLDLVKTNLVASSIAGTDMAQTAELLTSTMNGFKIESSEMIGIVDKFAKVGASASTSFEEMATAMSRTSTSARLVGVNIDQLIGLIK